MALLTQGDQITYSTLDVDRIGVLANIQALLSVATDIMTAKNDTPLKLIMRGARSTVVLMRVERTNLVVMCKNNVRQDRWEADIDKAALLLQKVLEVTSNLQDWHVT